MGLIVCPHCGKQVSDTNGKCFHCGFDFVNNMEGTTKPREYYKMSAKEQQNLRNEYLNQNPIFKKFEQKHKAFTKRLAISIMICVLSWACIAFLGLGASIYTEVTKKTVPTWVNIPAILLIVIVLVSTIICIVLGILNKKYRRNELLVEKNYQHWLKSEKNVNYTVAFSAQQSKDKMIFDEIDITKDKLEG